MSQILGLDQVTSRRCTQGMAYQKLLEPVYVQENADLVLRKSVKLNRNRILCLCSSLKAMMKQALNVAYKLWH